MQEEERVAFGLKHAQQASKQASKVKQACTPSKHSKASKHAHQAMGERMHSRKAEEERKVRKKAGEESTASCICLGSLHLLHSIAAHSLCIPRLLHPWISVQPHIISHPFLEGPDLRC